MHAEVRYYSRSGNTRAVAEALAAAAGVKAVSVDAPGSAIEEFTDVLFIGGALYAYGLDRKLSSYLKEIDAGRIGKAVVFSTSWISKHSVDLIKRALREKGVDVADEYFYVKNTPGEEDLKRAEGFARKYL